MLKSRRARNNALISAAFGIAALTSFGGGGALAVSAQNDQETPRDANGMVLQRTVYENGEAKQVSMDSHYTADGWFKLGGAAGLALLGLAFGAASVGYGERASDWERRRREWEDDQRRSGISPSGATPEQA